LHKRTIATIIVITIITQLHGKWVKTVSALLLVKPSQAT
jgi:hypothetical protein